MKFKLFKKIPKTPEERAQLRKDRLLLILSGFMLAAGFPPVPVPITLFFGLIPYLLVLEKRERLIDINRAAFLMSFIFSVFALYWVGAFTQWKDPYLMAGGAVLFFINPLAFMIPGTLYHFTRKYTSPKLALWLFPFFWVFYEYLYTLTDWSFPWLNLGNGAANFRSFIQIADMLGVWGVSFFIVCINLLLFFAYKHKRAGSNKNIRYSVAALLLMLCISGYGVYKIATLPQPEKILRTGIVQPNLDPYDKWAGNNIDEILDGYLKDSRLLLQQPTDILLWPETALPVYFMGAAYDDIRFRVFSFIDSVKVPLFSGMPDIRYYTENETGKPYDVKYNKAGKFYYATYNAIYMIHPNDRGIQKYGKNKLVPFGERVPFVDRLPILGDIMRWGVGIGGWNVGQDTNVIQLHPSRFTDTVGIGGVICYESIYTDAVIPQVQRGAQVLIVITNDSWYGNTSGPYQHRDFAKLRAVETRRSIIRAANGGISCVITPDGTVTTQTAMYEHTVLHAEVGLYTGETFYVQHPHVVTFTCTLVSLLALLLALIQKIHRTIKPSSRNAETASRE